MLGKYRVLLITGYSDTMSKSITIVAFIFIWTIILYWSPWWVTGTINDWLRYWRNRSCQIYC